MKVNQKKPAASARGRNLYALARGVDVKKFKPQTHAGATVLAITKLGKATTDKIIAEVKRRRLLRNSEMTVEQAIRFQLFDLSRRRGILKATKIRGSEAAA